MPNPWDVGQRAGAGAARLPGAGDDQCRLRLDAGARDNHVTLDEALEHLRVVADAVDVPVNADFEGGYAVEPEQVGGEREARRGHRDRRALHRGLHRRRADPLYEFDLAVERIRAARQAIDASGTGVVLTGRSEGFVVGRPDIDETIRRLRAYAEAGADCLYAPRLDDVEHVAAIVTAVAPKPVNLLINAPFITVAEAARLGVRRISVGGTLARTAWRGALETAQEIKKHGTFTGFAHLPDVDALFGRT